MKNIFATAASVFVLGFAMPAMAQSNTSHIKQYGLSNDADVDQIGTSANNSSTINQGVNRDSSNNSADVEQDGTFVQNNESKTTQDGADNGIIVKQGGIGSTGDRNKSTITQDGDGNNARVGQGNVGFTADFDSNKSTINQTGDGNTATVAQGGSAAAGDPAHEIALLIAGLNALGVNDGPNLSTIDQLGDGHIATVVQGGGSASNESHILQNDDHTDGGNSATVLQYGNSSNFSGIEQFGEGNITSVTQNSAFSVDNKSDVYQSGSLNTAIVNQH